jgi:hypothetical protein
MAETRHRAPRAALHWFVIAKTRFLKLASPTHSAARTALTPRPTQRAAERRPEVEPQPKMSPACSPRRRPGVAWALLALLVVLAPAAQGRPLAGEPPPAPPAPAPPQRPTHPTSA